MKQDTILTLGLLAIGGYVAYKVIGSSTKGISDAVGGVGGGIGDAVQGVGGGISSAFQPLIESSSDIVALMQQKTQNTIELWKLKGQEDLFNESKKFEQQTKINDLDYANKYAIATEKVKADYQTQTFAIKNNVINKEFYSNVKTTLFTNPVGSFQAGLVAIKNVVSGKPATMGTYAYDSNSMKIAGQQFNNFSSVSSSERNSSTHQSVKNPTSSFLANIYKSTPAYVIYSAIKKGKKK